MIVSLTDYHGNPAKMDPTRLLRLRPTLANLGDPDGCTLVDWGQGGIFALGNIRTLAGVFAPYVRLAGLHAPDGTPIYVNADAIDVVMVDGAYAGNSVAVVRRDFENINVPVRNKIALLENVEAATTILEAATADFGEG